MNEFAAGRLASITSIAYGKSDGMLNPECNGGRWPAGIKTRDGKLWFPTQDGVVVIDPEAIPFNPQPPPVVIESFLLDRALSRPSDLTARADRAGMGELRDRVHGLELHQLGALRFKYKLEGLDQDWMTPGRAARHTTHMFRRTVRLPRDCGQ